MFNFSRKTLTICLFIASVAVPLLGRGPAPCLAASSQALTSGPAASVPESAVSPQRLERISRTYLSVPYKLDCLGEGKAPDADPLFTRKYADCQTLVEQVLVEAVQPYVGGRDAAIRLIRYRGGEVSLANRYHYCVPDWLEHPWPARDVTGEVGSGHTRSTTRTIDRAALLHGRGLSGPEAELPVETVRTAYIPRADAPAVLKRIPDGSIIVFVLNRNDIVAGHLGFVFVKHGVPVLRQASQTQHKVIDEPLLAYLERAPKRFIGIQVLQPDVAGLRR